MVPLETFMVMKYNEKYFFKTLETMKIIKDSVKMT